MVAKLTTWRSNEWILSGVPESKVHGPTRGPSGADRTHVGPMLAPWTLLFGVPNRYPSFVICAFAQLMISALYYLLSIWCYTSAPIIKGKLQFLAATKQLYEWYFLSICPSVRPSVCHTFLLCSHHRVITKDKGKVHAKDQGQRSKVKVTEATTQLQRLRTVTPVWIHIGWWNDAYSLMLINRGSLLFLKVIRQISKSHGSKNRQIWPRLGVSGL